MRRQLSCAKRKTECAFWFVTVRERVRPKQLEVGAKGRTRQRELRSNVVAFHFEVMANSNAELRGNLFDLPRQKTRNRSQQLNGAFGAPRHPENERPSPVLGEGLKVHQRFVNDWWGRNA